MMLRMRQPLALVVAAAMAGAIEAKAPALRQPRIAGPWPPPAVLLPPPNALPSLQRRLRRDPASCGCCLSIAGLPNDQFDGVYCPGGIENDAIRYVQCVIARRLRALLASAAAPAAAMRAPASSPRCSPSLLHRWPSRTNRTEHR